MNPAEATRPIYWNITQIWVMYAALLPVAVIAAYGVYRHVRRWRAGQPLARFDHSARRFRFLVQHALAQSRTATDQYAGTFHGFIFFGFIVLTIATTVVALDADFGTAIMRGNFYLYFQSFTVDVFGALVLVGIGMASARRFLARPKRLVYSHEAAWILAVLFLIALTGFLIEGWRIAVTNDPWAWWSPFGNLVAHASRVVLTVKAMKAAHAFMWWLHLALSLGLIAWIPYTKMMHLISAPLNIYTANLEPIGASLKAIDFESATTFGVNSLARFTWKDLLDLDACTECGRCTDVCPANAVGKELSPRDLILELRRLMHSADTAVALAAPIIDAVPATAPARLWQCTTCAACVQACPVFIEQMAKIVDLRRFLVMEEAQFPDSMQEAITSLETRRHPFRGTQATRLDWTEGLEIAHVSERKEADVLFWVGCSGALLERNQKVTRATAQLLNQAGVKFAILGREEKCCGDPARRVGNEFLFETLAKDNVAALMGNGIREIVTACPHCFNTLKHEYPRYGGAFKIHHHTEYLAELISQGRLRTPANSGKKITFHDPCYLGRQNGVFEAPRRLVQISAGGPALEMKRNRSASFCCGGGGGMCFVEEPAGQRVNQERAREALATGADVVAVACPFCMTMMEDGIKARKGAADVRVMDVSELLWQSLQAEALP